MDRAYYCINAASNTGCRICMFKKGADVEIDLSKEAPNVVTEPLLKRLLESGYLAEVVCTTDAFRTGSVWYGVWIIRVVDKERTFERMLVPARTRASDATEIKRREFKTVNGLISFFKGIGITQVNVPIVEGGRAIHKLPAIDAGDELKS